MGPPYQMAFRKSFSSCMAAGRLLSITRIASKCSGAAWLELLKKAENTVYLLKALLQCTLYNFPSNLELKVQNCFCCSCRNEVLHCATRPCNTCNATVLRCKLLEKLHDILRALKRTPSGPKLLSALERCPPQRKFVQPDIPEHQIETYARAKPSAVTPSQAWRG